MKNKLITNGIFVLCFSGIDTAIGEVYTEDFNIDDGGWFITDGWVNKGSSQFNYLHEPSGGIRDSGYLKAKRKRYAGQFSPDTSDSSIIAAGDLASSFGKRIRISYFARIFEGGATDQRPLGHNIWSSVDPSNFQGWRLLITDDLTPYLKQWTKVSFEIDTTWTDLEAEEAGWEQWYGDTSWQDTVQNITKQEFFYGFVNKPGITIVTGIDDVRVATATNMWDVDGNGENDALTDGILIIRYLFGFRGDTLVSEAVAPDCTRCTANEIEAYLGTE